MNPAEKLDVVGNIKASGTICDVNGCIGNGGSGGVMLSVITLGDPREHSNYRHTCAVMSDGSVNCWGANGLGEVGVGREASARYLPETVPLPSPAKTLAIAHRNNYALLENGQVYAWGTNGNGQLGIGSTADYDVPVRVGSLTGITQIVASQGNNDAATACALKSDRTVWCWYNYPEKQSNKGSWTH